MSSILLSLFLIFASFSAFSEETTETVTVDNAQGDHVDSIQITPAMVSDRSIPVEILVLSKDNSLILNRDFNDQSVQELISRAQKLDSNLPSGYPIYLYLDTPGGLIDSGLTLFEFFMGLNRPVYTITSFAASMGFQAVQALGKRYILSTGVLMAHKARGGFSGEFGDGQSQLDSRYGLWMSRLLQLDLRTVERSGGKLTLEKFRSEIENELWLTGPQAVARGYADAVAVVSCDLSLKESTYNSSVDFLGLMKINVTFSSCPLNTAPLSIAAELETNQGPMGFKEFLNKGGKFGADCLSNKEDSWRSSYVTEENKVQKLCASNPTLKIEDVFSAISEVKKGLEENKKDKVMRSY